ncbi:MAG: glutamine--fructose-6-phosphate transaminase (isomerizing) [Bacilli bacterium]|nr:glutamine--fructose-6-phosphate transaminase (isomerizing) [Bacilli bacterium]
MCGIVGYIGKKKALPILINSLKTLEYRGYDSSGIAYMINNEIKIVKDVGKINVLENKINLEVNTYMGIGHTRWATHGGVTINNSHPHRVGNITLVHNGIIENYLELKNKLIDLDYKFIGETDSEVLCALIDYYYNKTENIIHTIEKVIKEIKGSYATAIIVDDDYDNIYVIRKDSPLIIGIGNDENFIASDVPAILGYTNKYILLNDYDIAKISNKEITVYNNGSIVKKDINEFEYENDVVSKQGYNHYMLKEIHEVSSLVRNNLVDNLRNIPDIKKYKNIYIVACGSAYHAGLIGKNMLEELINKPVYVEIASEFRYKKLFLDKEDLVIIISQSGETADTLASLRVAKEYGTTTLGIVNVFGSSIAREASIVVYTNALIEIAVATTKAFVMQLYTLGLIAIKNSNIRYSDVISNYRLLANQVDSILENNIYKEVAKLIYKEKDIFFLGRGIDYYIAMEGNLKLKEIAYIHSESYPAGELKHGTIALIEKDTPVISVITNNIIKDKILSNIKEVISRGAKSIIVATDDIKIDKSYYDILIQVPTNIDVLKPILAIIPLQLLAYEVALLNNCDIDKPRNLAKSVTVE